MTLRNYMIAWSNDRSIIKQIIKGDATTTGNTLTCFSQDVLSRAGRNWYMPHSAFGSLWCILYDMRGMAARKRLNGNLCFLKSIFDMVDLALQRASFACSNIDDAGILHLLNHMNVCFILQLPRSDFLDILV